MIASGSSLRGLSEVTMTTSARSRATLPISGRLLTVAVAAGPEDHDHAPFRELARRPEHVVERVRLVRIVDHHGEGLPFVDGFESPRHALERGDPGGDVVLGDVEQDSGRDHAEDVLDVEAATQVRLNLDPAGRESRARRAELELVGPDLGVVGKAEGNAGARGSYTRAPRPTAVPTRRRC